jgi:hypothetical protein
MRISFSMLRGKISLWHHDVVMITGYTEALSIYNDAARFSSCTAR